MSIIDLATARRARCGCGHKIVRPHRPEDRIVVEMLSIGRGATEFGEWQARIFDPAGKFQHYFAHRALLHVQLWNPFFGVSILSPSRLTGFNYESFRLGDWKYASPHYGEVTRRLQAGIALRLPNENLVDQICHSHIGEPERSYTYKGNPLTEQARFERQLW
jgi:hypothetical protein